MTSRNNKGEEAVEGDEPHCATGPDALGESLKWGCSSKEVFLSYVYLESENPARYNAAQIISKACYEAWIGTRRSHPKSPEKSFQRSLTAHIVGSGGRRPFQPEVEAPLLVELRQKRVWPCFVGTSCQIGLFGIRVKGYHERRAGEQPSLAPESVSHYAVGRKTRNSTKLENNQIAIPTAQVAQSAGSQWNGVQLRMQEAAQQSIRSLNNVRMEATDTSKSSLSSSSNVMSSQIYSPQMPKLRSYDTATSLVSEHSLSGLVDALPDVKKSRLRTYGSSRSENKFETLNALLASRDGAVNQFFSHLSSGQESKHSIGVDQPAQVLKPYIPQTQHKDQYMENNTQFTYSQPYHRTEANAVGHGWPNGILSSNSQPHASNEFNMGSIDDKQMKRYDSQQWELARYDSATSVPRTSERGSEPFGEQRIRRFPSSFVVDDISQIWDAIKEESSEQSQNQEPQVSNTSRQLLSSTGVPAAEKHRVAPPAD